MTVWQSFSDDKKFLKVRLDIEDESLGNENLLVNYEQDQL